MNKLMLYRRRLIPDECILLKDDSIVRQTEDIIVTSWKTLNPKTVFQYGASCYFLKEGIKVSKFYRADKTLFCWYCDIVEYAFNPADNSLTVTDLLADVILQPDGAVKVMDLDELAEALEQKLISEDTLKAVLLRLNRLLTLIYEGNFHLLAQQLDTLGL